MYLLEAFLTLFHIPEAASFGHVSWSSARINSSLLAVSHKIDRSQLLNLHSGNTLFRGLVNRKSNTLHRARTAAPRFSWRKNRLQVVMKRKTQTKPPGRERHEARKGTATASPSTRSRSAKKSGASATATAARGKKVSANDMSTDEPQTKRAVAALAAKAIASESGSNRRKTPQSESKIKDAKGVVPQTPAKSTKRASRASTASTSNRTSRPLGQQGHRSTTPPPAANALDSVAPRGIRDDALR